MRKSEKEPSYQMQDLQVSKAKSARFVANLANTYLITRKAMIFQLRFVQIEFVQVESV